MTSLQRVLERHRVMWGGTIGLRRTPRELIDGAAAAGYRHVSMSAQDLRALGDDGLDGLRRYGDARSVTVVMIDGFYPWMPLAGSILEGAVGTLDEVLQQAEVVGARFIGALALPLGLSTDDMAERFAVARERVADAGCTITLEFAPLGGVIDLAAAHAVISPSGYRSAGIVFDTWHFFRGTPDFDLLETMDDGQIAAVQMSDAAAEVRGSLWHDTVHHRRQPGDVAPGPPTVRGAVTMDPRYSAEAESFRARVQTFLAEQLPDGWQGIGALPHDEALEFTTRWRATLHEHGFLGVSWPREYGGAGLSKLEQVVLVEELARAGVPAVGPNDNFSLKMVGNTLLQWGTEAQKRRFLPRILSDEDRWFQGYSEPEASSDLAGLRTRAKLVGDEWVLNGQKIWQTQAHEANWIFVLARTDPDAPKHRGLTMFLVPMEQRGVEVRPIATMGGHADFNAVFLVGARTSTDNVVGEVNDGWTVAQSLLGLERGDEAATNPVQFRAEWDRLVVMARELGRLDDPVLRDRITDAYVRVETMRFLGYRILTGVLTTGVIGPEASISKLYWSEYHREVTRLAVDLLGAHALVVEGRAPLRTYRADDPGAPNSSASWIGALYNGVADTIYAGTSEVQRGILGERILGLPREPAR